MSLNSEFPLACSQEGWCRQLVGPEEQDKEDERGQARVRWMTTTRINGGTTAGLGSGAQGRG